MNNMEWKKLHEQMKQTRIEEIRSRIVFSLTIVALICTGIALYLMYTCTDDVEAKQIFKKPDLWVGASQEDFSYSVAVESDTEEDVSESDEESTDIDYSDVELLAKVIYLEGGTQSSECCEMIGCTILNRISSDRGRFKYQHTITDVVSSPHQYTTYEKALRLDIDEVPDSIYAIAEKLIKYGSTDPTPLFQHYKRAVKDTTFYKRIGTEVFSY